MDFSRIITVVFGAETGVGDVKLSPKAVFRCIYAKFLSTFYVSGRKPAKVPASHMIMHMSNNKIRNATCQKQLHQLHCFWSLDFLPAQIHHLQQALHQSLSPLWQSRFHKNCQHNRLNSPPLRGPGIPLLNTCGGCPC